MNETQRRRALADVKEFFLRAGALAALLRINGSLVAEPDIYETTPRYDSDVTYPLTLADGEYFILCDAREGAPDSRRYGPVEAGNIAGRVIAIVRRNEI